MKKPVIAAITASAIFIGGAATVSATKPEPEHKVWVCHATSGLGELKNGYNLIHVDVASTRYEGHLQHATDKPKNNSKFGVLYDYIDVNPQDLPGQCGYEPPPETTTTTVVEPTTTVITETTVPNTPTTATPSSTTTETPRIVEQPSTTRAPVPLPEAQPAVPIPGEPKFTG